MGIYGHTWDKYRIDLHPELIDENVITDALKKFIDGIKKVIVAAIDKINGLLDKHPDSKIAQGLKSLLTRFKNFLTRADKVNNKEDATKLKSDVDEANEELKSMTSSSDTSGLTDEFKKAVEDEKFLRIKIMIKDSLLIDKTFKTAEKEINYAKSKGLDIFVPGNKWETKPQSEWDEDYMNSKLVEIVNNFTKENFEDLKKIVKYVTSGNFKKEEPKKEESKKEEKPNSNIHKAVEECVKNKDYKRIRFIFVDALDVDPTFIKYKADWDYCVKNAPEFLQDHQELTEFKNNPKDWNRDYYLKIKRDLEKNFSKERYDHLKKVAKVTYAEKIARLTKERTLSNVK